MDLDFAPLLMGSDRRSTGRSQDVVNSVEDQESFDALFRLLLHHERTLVMRAADAVEKITAWHPEFLRPHKPQLLSLLKGGGHKELKWHLAQLMARVPLTEVEFGDVWDMLRYWLQNPHESKIVRVNSLQGLFDLSYENPVRRQELRVVVGQIDREAVPSLQARLRKLRKSGL